jgi:hypothetical protein
VQCHVPNGVGPNLSSKLAGTSRIIKAALDSYQGPIRSSFEHASKVNARCRECHRLDTSPRTKQVRVHYFRFDESNTPEHITLNLNLGAGAADTTGAHWHADARIRVSYAASDPLRQKIPWFHVRRLDGSERTYSSHPASLGPDPAAKLPKYELGCVDCHNRAGHEVASPDASVDRALLAGTLPTSLPWIKKRAVHALTMNVPDSGPAESIEQALIDSYRTLAPGVLLEQTDQLKAAGKELAMIRASMVFPVLRVDHTSYPNNLGHRHWPGCFRCHDGQHLTPDGEVLSQDCGQTCHTQPQRGAESARAEREPGADDWHPWPSPAKLLDIAPHRQLLCSDCHGAGTSPKRTCDDCHAPN